MNQSPNRPKIILESCIGSDNPAFVRHFVSHYKALGVDQFVVVVHANPGRASLSHATSEELRAHGIEPAQLWIGPYSRAERTARLQQLVSDCTKPSDWIVSADGRELIECDRFGDAPSAFRELLHLCDVFGHTCVRGLLVDMVAMNGELKAVDVNAPLRDQYPVACNLSKKVLKENCRRIVARRGFHRCTADGANVTGPASRPWPTVLRVNCFNWDESAVERLAAAGIGTSHIEKAGQRGDQRREGNSLVRPRVDLDPLDLYGRKTALGGWAISPLLLKFLVTHISQGSAVLELGSGTGTEELAHYYRMYSIEHDPLWVGRYRSHYIYAPLRDGWYDVDAIRHGVRGLTPSAILIDGPPSSKARRGFVHNIELFNLECILIFDDVNRPDDRAAFLAIRDQFHHRHAEIVRGAHKSFGVIYPALMS